MSEIATRNLLASARSKRAISEHTEKFAKRISGVPEKQSFSQDAQKHAPHFSAGSVFDIMIMVLGKDCQA